MDATTAVLILWIIAAELRAARAAALTRLTVDVLREQQRHERDRRDAERVRALAFRIREVLLRDVSPAMQRARLEPPAELAGLLGQLDEEG